MTIVAAGRKKPRDFRDVDGVLVLDKPGGCSSNQALQRVRAFYSARKAGHCGSLDPLATGVLPLCLGQATRFSGYLLDAHKTYVATCKLGQTTTTGDAEGELVETRPARVDEAQVCRVLEDFSGDIEQVPPMYSALKHRGRRLYQLAREGQTVEREARSVRIYENRLLSLDAESLAIEVRCSKGTYIRSLAEDIGEALGCGAHLTALRRTAVDSLSLSDAVSMETLEALSDGKDLRRLDDLLLPVTTLLIDFPELRLDADSTRDIQHGKRLVLTRGEEVGLYRLVSPQERFLGLGEVFANGELAAKRLMNTTT